MTWKIGANAKINLTLYVLGKRPDGYHDLELIFQPVSLADELTIEENSLDRLVFSCSVPAFQNQDNLVCRGYEAMRTRWPGRIPGLNVHLEKHIPSGAGMGGGSTDCSAFMLWLYGRYIDGPEKTCSAENNFYTFPGGTAAGAELIRIGAGLGADVPACMISHATLGRGIGEDLTDIHTTIAMPLLVIKPDVSFSTGEMYGRVDSIPYNPEENRNPGMIRALEEGRVEDVAKNLYNVFEQVIPEPEYIGGLKELLAARGALGSLMTGSGSAVYGIFADRAARDAAYESLSSLHGCTLYRCETVNL